MKVVNNQKIIQRNKKIGQYTMGAALVLFGIGLYFTFFNEEYINFVFPLLILGFFAAQFGSYYSTKFGLSPRPDEILISSLKGLDNHFTLYNYITPISHLLVGPAGIWILLPYHQAGTITFDPKSARWKQKGGNLYLKIFGQEALGRPDQQVRNYEKEIKKYLNENFSSIELPEINTMLVFTSEKARIEIEEATHPTLPASKIKDFFRKRKKVDDVPLEIITMIQKTLPQEDILPKQKKH